MKIWNFLAIIFVLLGLLAWYFYEYSYRNSPELKHQEASRLQYLRRVHSYSLPTNVMACGKYRVNIFSPMKTILKKNEFGENVSTYLLLKPQYATVSYSHKKIVLQFKNEIEEITFSDKIAFSRYPTDSWTPSSFTYHYWIIDWKLKNSKNEVIEVVYDTSRSSYAGFYTLDVRTGFSSDGPPFASIDIKIRDQSANFKILEKIRSKLLTLERSEMKEIYSTYFLYLNAKHKEEFIPFQYYIDTTKDYIFWKKGEYDINSFLDKYQDYWFLF